MKVLTWSDILEGQAAKLCSFRLKWAGVVVGNMRKEERRGRGYWYLYRRVDKKLLKAYVGKLPRGDSMDARVKFVNAINKIKGGQKKWENGNWKS